MRLVIVGGVAGGASAAARARRLSEEAEIILLERGPYISLGGLDVFGLAGLELSYAPQFSSARDPVNYAGMIASDMLRGDTAPVYPGEIPDEAFILDVREPIEISEGAIPGSTMIPLGQLRERIDELPRDRKIVVYCRVGLRAYLAERILRQKGFDAANLSGGLHTWKLFQG